ncbi:MAG: substrate-binding domain-containing protein [Gemmiger sp.]
MKRKIALVCAAAMALSLAACGSTASSSESTAASESTASESTAASDSTADSAEADTAEADAAASDFDTTQAITVITREEGSGTRSAFVELTGVEDDSGDRTTQGAATQNSTNGVMTTVANDETAIGYISLGSLDDSVKAVSVGGVAASADTVKDGTYTLSRPFNIVTNGEATDPVAVDFIGFCMGADGQALATEEGYIGTDGAEAFTSTQPSGNITVGGSSSVSPLMEKLIEAYGEVNPNATIELMTTDSTTGVTGALDGTYTIGMASRELSEDEQAQGATATVLALDGIAVVVNPANPVSDMTTEQICSIYLGETTTWDQL